jgi:phage portal protein BeeE
MGILDSILKAVAPNTIAKIARDESRSRVEPVTQNDLAHYLGGGTAWTNIDVDRYVAMGLPIVWACVKLLSEALASFPLILYEEGEKGKKKATAHPLFDLLYIQPNEQQDAFSLKEQLMGHLAVYGNAYCNLVRDGAGYVKEIWPLNPERMFPFRIDGNLFYRYRASPYFQTQDLFFRSQDEWEKRKADWNVLGDKNLAQNPWSLGNGYKNYPDQVESILSSDQVWHIHGFGFDGIRGYSPLELQKQTIAIGIAAQHYAADFFANNGTPDLAFEHPHHITDPVARRIQASWRDNHSRWGKKHTPIILEDGMTVKQLSLDPEKTQLVETQKYLLTEICRVYHVQPHMVQDLERATFSNIEQQSIEFVVHTMRPWAVRWESSIMTQLLSAKDRKKYFPEFQMDSILRGDSKTRAERDATLVGIGALNPDEVRAMEGWNPRDDGNGDIYYVPVNWTPAVSREPVSAKPEPVPAQDDTEAPKPKPKKDEERQLKLELGPLEAQTRALSERVDRVFEFAASRSEAPLTGKIPIDLNLNVNPKKPKPKMIRHTKIVRDEAGNIAGVESEEIPAESPTEIEVKE